MRLSNGESVVDAAASIHPEATIRRSVIMGSAAISASVIIEDKIISADESHQYKTRVQ